MSYRPFLPIKVKTASVEDRIQEEFNELVNNSSVHNLQRITCEVLVQNVWVLLLG